VLAAPFFPAEKKPEKQNALTFMVGGVMNRQNEARIF
jgi:hypothetical protein